MSTRILAVLALLVVGACQEPLSIQCSNGLVCPAGQQCAAHQDVCIKDLCGNGVKDPGEACDDGNLRDGDGCNRTCTSVEVCGNSVVDVAAGEVCDDGNTADGDGCSADCKSSEMCGNRIVDTAIGEVCDDGNRVSGDGCSKDCLSNETCGNGYKDVIKGEVCDDGNNSDADGCSSNCKSDETCGNKIVDVAVGEACDDGNHDDGDHCSADCKSNETCGNNIVDTSVGEKCDPPGPSCSADCRSGLGCGNGIRDSLEECDTGGTLDTATCNMAPALDALKCTLPRCGDGYTNLAAGETCDTSNLDTNLCNGLLCTGPNCGDGYTNNAAGEECDSGGTTDTTYCDMSLTAPSRCHVPVCGDGYKSASEDCDSSGADLLGCNGLTCTTPACGDGYVNLAAGEACDSGGTIDRASCNMGTAAAANRCQRPRCGDGYSNAQAGEACDDGNPSNTDDCLASCVVASCGDGFTDSVNGSSLKEDCDDGALNGTTTCPYGAPNGQCDICKAGCKSGTANGTGPYCGDGQVTNGEVCDDHEATCGACNASCTQIVAGAATGTLFPVKGSNLNDAEYFTLRDGVHPDVVFEYDTDNMTTGVKIAFTNGNDVNTVAQNTITAINGAANLNIVATGPFTSPDNSVFILLTNTKLGAAGNVAIDEHVADAGFAIFGMTGGGGYDCSGGAKCTSNADCKSGECKLDGTCQ